MHLKKPSDAASTTTTLAAESLGSSGTDDAQLPSGGAEDTQLSHADDAPLSSGDAPGAELTRSSADDTQLPSNGACDKQLSSGEAAGQAQTSQTEVERLRRALADAEHAELVLHAEHNRLQAKLLARCA